MAKGKARKQYNQKRRNFDFQKQQQRDDDASNFFVSDLTDDTKKKREKKIPYKNFMQGYADLSDPSKLQKAFDCFFEIAIFYSVN